MSDKLFGCYMTTMTEILFISIVVDVYKYFNFYIYMFSECL